jgi:PKD repeat protein/N-acetylneuraminic acid mutarotase
LVFVTAAGNLAKQHYQGLYKDDGNHYNDFRAAPSTPDKYLYITMQNPDTILIEVQWDDKWGTSVNDYDLYLIEKDTANIVVASTGSQPTYPNPVESIPYQYTGSQEKTFEIRVKNAGPGGAGQGQAKNLKLFVFRTGGDHSNTIQPDTNYNSIDSIFGLQAAKEAITVGALPSGWAGIGNENQIASYSSRGPSTIAYPSPESRQKPDICGITNVNITGAGGFGFPQNGAYIFTGTSAAAPHIAGIIALAKQANSSLNRSEIKQFLSTSADDLGDPGWDPIYGYGRANAMKMIQTIIPPPPTDFTATPRSGSAPLTVQFNDTSTNSPTAWDWNFGDEDVIHWSARGDHTSVALSDGSIVLMGGNSVAGYKNDVWRSTDYGTTWSLLNTSPGWQARWGHTSVVMPDDSIVLMGGWIGDWPLVMNDVWRSTDKGKTWTLMNASSGWVGRGYHTSVALPDGSIVLMGGYDNVDERKDVWRSADMGATWLQVNSSPIPIGWMPRRDPSSVVLSDGSILLTGGYPSEAVNYIWRSTDRGNTWMEVVYNPPWMWRSGHTSVVMPDGKVILMGGIDQDGKIMMNDIWQSDNKGITWTPVNGISRWTGRVGHSTVVMPDGSIVLTGGVAYRNGYTEMYNDIWRSTDRGVTWTQVNIPPSWTSQAKNASHTYTTPGTYTVSLTTNAPDNNVTTKTDYITVYLPISSLPGQGLPPGDPDDDGMYEDVDGSGDVGYPDVVAFFRQLDWISVNEPVSAFDFNQNGRIEFDDIVRLNKKRLSQ